MSTSSAAATTTPIDHAQDLGALATRWPQFSARELDRLRFLVYLRQTGRIHRPAPVRAEVDALCTALLTDPGRPDPGPPRRPTGGAVPPAPPRRAAPGGVPPMWAAWSEKYGTLRPDRAGRRPYPYVG